MRRTKMKHMDKKKTKGMARGGAMQGGKKTKGSARGGVVNPSYSEVMPKAGPN